MSRHLEGAVIQSKTLTTLQAGRAVAAIAVVVSHADIALGAFSQPLPPLLGTIAGFGYLGVDFFFVLSGFIIAYAHGSDKRTSVAAAGYIRKRLVRIYVPYLPVAIALVGLYFLLPNLSAGNRQWGIVTSLTLLPVDGPPALSVAWTLVHEMAFYALFLLFYVTRWFPMIVGAWVAGIMALWLGGFEPGERTGWDAAFFALINLEFVGGMVAAWLCVRLPSAAWWLSMAIGVALATMFFAVAPDNRVVFGLGMVFVVIGLYLLEQRGLRAPGWLVYLGGASYAIYLLHNPLISVVARATALLPLWPVGLSACLAASIVAGCCYHQFFERPALRWARATLGLPQRKPAAEV